MGETKAKMNTQKGCKQGEDKAELSRFGGKRLVNPKSFAFLQKGNE